MGNLTKTIKEEVVEIEETPKEAPKKSKGLKIGKSVSKSASKSVSKQKTDKIKVETRKLIEDNDNLNNGRVFMFFGEEGTGKTYASLKIAKKYGKTLYLDTENKCTELLESKFTDLQYDIIRPIIDDGKKFSQVFREDSDVHAIVVQKINMGTGMSDASATVKFIKEMTPKLLHFIKSGKYKVLIIDSVLPIWEYSIKEWLHRNKGRKRPSKFEWAEIEAIRQDILFPFINFCKIFGVHLIITASISGHYVNDVMIGYKQDAKSWLLHILTYELWFSRDYKKYIIKHPYKPFWEIQDEDLNISDYLFDNSLIDNNQVNFKNFEDFKYETMTSNKERNDRKQSNTIKVGK